MALTLTTASKNAILNTLWNQADAGAAAGYFEVQIVGNVEAATLTFSDPAFAAASAGSKTADPITSDTNATGNATDVTLVQFFDSNDLAFAQGTAALTGGNLNLSTLTISSGDTVSCSSMTASIAA